jgi:hypothetical protein
MGGRLRSESPADFVGMRTSEQGLHDNRQQHNDGD